jgi:hypothetical protein
MTKVTYDKQLTAVMHVSTRPASHCCASMLVV